ncbi:MAG: phosphoglycerol transferase MdoB-like AlkP superfamily enzyme [Planctomycetota bacterium]|jgi:phosphoglycerol transferase MdoB-like AlkP superfamily enzyme
MDARRRRFEASLTFRNANHGDCVPSVCLVKIFNEKPLRLGLLPRLLGPYGMVLGFAICLFAVLSASRALFAIYYAERVHAVAGYAWMFAYGMRMDAIVVCSVLVLPVAVLACGASPVRLRPFLRAYFTAALLLVTTMELMSISFINEYDARPNRLFIENLVPNAELRATIWADYKFVLMGIGVVLGLALWGGWRLSGRLVTKSSTWSRRVQVAVAPLAIGLLVSGIRGFDHRPVNVSSAFFSTDRLVNELSLNSTYSAAYAAYRRRHESSPTKLYGKMDEAQVVARVRKYLNVDPGCFQSQEIPFLRPQSSRVVRKRPANVVIILEESLGAMFCGCLGGLPLTPELDALAKEGLLFRQMYSTGTRTVRGIEAAISGFLPTPGRSVVKLERSQSGFFTVAQMLQKHGYATGFVYGGESHFDNMRAFLLGNGFEKVMDQTTFESPTFHGTWGVSDEDLMREANASFVAHGDQPFMALILSTSNHTPFEFPAGRIELHEEPQATRHNSVKYADHALGELFRMAKKEDYFANTIWIIVADHNMKTFGDDLIPIDKFHIPALIIGPGVQPGTYNKVASQVDLMPTVLPLLGLDFEHPMLGRDVLSLPSDEPGRAVMQQFDTHALMIGDRVVVHQPLAEPQQFVFRNRRLVPSAVDPEFELDGLAHALAPWLLYSQSRHRLPK